MVRLDQNCAFSFFFSALFYVFNPPKPCHLWWQCQAGGRADSAHFTSLSPAVQTGQTPDTFTQAQIYWEGVKDLWDIPGSQLHFSSSLKDPVICHSFQGPAACQRDGQGCQLSEDLACARLCQVLEIPVGVFMLGEWPGTTPAPHAGSARGFLTHPAQAEQLPLSSPQRSASFLMPSPSLQSRVLFPSGNNAHCCR